MSPHDDALRNNTEIGYSCAPDFYHNLSKGDEEISTISIISSCYVMFCWKWKVVKPYCKFSYHMKLFSNSHAHEWLKI